MPTPAGGWGEAVESIRRCFEDWGTSGLLGGAGGTLGFFLVLGKSWPSGSRSASNWAGRLSPEEGPAGPAGDSAWGNPRERPLPAGRPNRSHRFIYFN